MTDLPPEYEDYLYGWRAKPFDYVSEKIIMFGYPVFGGWLPFAEFYTWWQGDVKVCRVFEVSWMCRGFMVSYRHNEDLFDD